MDISIRPWCEHDYNSIAKLFLQVHELHQKSRPDIYVKTDCPFSKADFAEAFESENTIGLLAVSGENVLGHTRVTLNQTSGSAIVLPRKVAKMEELAVDERFRRLGIGRLLFDAAREKARELGFERMELTVWGFNETARSFYKSLGMSERSIVMELELQTQFIPEQGGKEL